MAEFKTRLRVGVSYTDENTVDRLEERFSFTDTVSRHLTKVFADQFPVQDVFSYGWDIPRVLSDTMTAIDSTAFAVSKALTGDALSFSDTAALTAGKGISDSATMTDVATLAPNKTINETVTLTDSFVMSFTAQYGDSFTLSDSFSKAPNKGIADTLPGFVDSVDVVPGTFFGDSVGSTDAAALTIDKAFNDDILFTDNANLDYLGGQSFSETVGFAVQFTFASTKSLTESIALAETGSLRMQDYAAEDFFAEDYVVATTRFW